MSLAFRTLKLPPQDFWSLSLPEWRALTQPPPAQQPLSRADLAQLMALYPD